MEKVDAVNKREQLEELAALQALGALEAGSPELAAWLEGAGPEEEALLAELEPRRRRWRLRLRPSPRGRRCASGSSLPSGPGACPLAARAGAPRPGSLWPPR